MLASNKKFITPPYVHFRQTQGPFGCSLNFDPLLILLNLELVLACKAHFLVHIIAEANVLLLLHCWHQYELCALQCLVPVVLRLLRTSSLLNIYGAQGGIRTRSVSKCRILSPVRFTNFATCAYNYTNAIYSGCQLNLVQGLGIEPSSTALQAVAEMTTLAHPA